MRFSHLSYLLEFLKFLLKSKKEPRSQALGESFSEDPRKLMTRVTISGYMVMPLVQVAGAVALHLAAAAVSASAFVRATAGTRNARKLSRPSMPPVNACTEYNNFSGIPYELEPCGENVCPIPNKKIRCQGRILLPCDLLSQLDFGTVRDGSGEHAVVSGK